MGFLDGRFQIEASAASGIEAVVKRELSALGYLPSGANYGRIRFEGDFRDVLRANVFLRTANRVRIILAEFNANTFDELFDNTNDVNWKDILPKDAAITINAKSIKSKLFSVRSIQSIVKKAIVSAMQRDYGIARLSESGVTY